MSLYAPWAPFRSPRVRRSPALPHFSGSPMTSGGLPPGGPGTSRMLPAATLGSHEDTRPCRADGSLTWACGAGFLTGGVKGTSREIETEYSTGLSLVPGTTPPGGPWGGGPDCAPEFKALWLSTPAAWSVCVRKPPRPPAPAAGLLGACFLPAALYQNPAPAGPELPGAKMHGIGHAGRGGGAKGRGHSAGGGGGPEESQDDFLEGARANPGRGLAAGCGRHWRG